MSNHSRSHYLPRLLTVSFVVFLVCLCPLLLRGPQPAKLQRIGFTDSLAAAIPTQTKLSLQGETARQYFEQTGEGKSLMTAVTAARFGWKPLERAPSGASGSGYFGKNDEQNLSVLFSDGGLTVQPDVSTKAKAWGMQMRLREYGYGEQLTAAGPIVSQMVKGPRIENARSSLSPVQSTLIEWYENGPKGIEQGFTIHEKPQRYSETQENEPLRLVLELEGDLRSRLKDGGREIELVNASGDRVLSYSKLIAVDANGRELASSMEMNSEGREIALLVDDRDAQYPILIDPLIWQENGRFTGNDAAYDEVGYAVSISGDTAIVGCFHDQFSHGGGLNTNGRIFIFNRRASSVPQEPGWEFQIAFDGDTRGFGFAVDIDGDSAIVGDYIGSYDFNLPSWGSGAAYIYRRSEGNWTLKKRIEGNDAHVGSDFGASVAISDHTAVIGAPGFGSVFFRPDRGAAYVFTSNTGDWVQQTKLEADDGANDDRFGLAVDISGDTIIVGAPYHDVIDSGTNLNQGKAYVFVRNGGIWAAPVRLIGGGGAPNDQFGISVGISGNTAVVGASGPDHESAAQGLAYIFGRNGTAWNQQQILFADDGQRRNAFGLSVAISGETIIVGAPSSNVGPNQRQGAAYVFGRDHTQWIQKEKLTAIDGQAIDVFGYSVGVGGGNLVVGAPGHDIAGRRNQGEVYFFQQVDSDGDALPDEWEKNGVTIDGVFVDLPAMGANPMQPDVFVHLDWMGPLSDPNPKSIKMVADSFNLAGINLHVDFGPTSIMNYDTGATWGPLSKAGPVPFQQVFDPAPIPTGASFDSAIEPFKAIRFKPAGRNGIFHYTLYCMEIDNEKVAGRGERPGTDFVVGVDSLESPIIEATAFMHELGHNLGLDHGGDEETNYKPNYLSIMNYRFEVIGYLTLDGRQREIDYSNLALPPLDETNLNEVVGIRDPDAHLTLWNKYTRNDVPAGSNKCVQNPNIYHLLFFPLDALDWNCDGLQTVTSVVADLNQDGRCVYMGADLTLNSRPSGDDVELGPYIDSGPNHICETVAAGPCNAQGQGCDDQLLPPGSEQPVVLTGFNDWAALVFDGDGGIGRLNNTSRLATKVRSQSGGPSDAVRRWPKELPLAKIMAEIPPALLAEESVAPLDEVTFSPRQGPASLTVNFDGSASTAVTGTIVTWAWKFGDGSTGAGPTVTHSYTTPGEYAASLTVTDSSGRVNLVPMRHFITVTPAAPVNIINLTPNQAPGWSDKIIVSQVPGTHTDNSPLTSNVELYVDWAAINDGSAQTNVAFTNKLFVDGIERQFHTTNSPFRNNDKTGLQDYPIGMLTAGQHTIRIVLDTGGVIAESNETDNEYTKVVNVIDAPTPLPTPTPLPLPTPTPGIGDVDRSLGPTVTGIGGRPVNVVITQSDGKIIVGGEFESYAGCARRNIARVNADGSCDPTFDPGLDLTVIYQNQIGAQIVDGSHRVGLPVHNLALQSDGKILVGVTANSGFQNGVLSSSKMILRLNPDGKLDPSFNGPDSSFLTTTSFGIAFSGVSAIATQPDGRIIIAGRFTYSNNTTSVMRLNSDGSVDSTLAAPSVPYQGPNASYDSVRAIALQPDGKIILGGFFGHISLALTKHGIARLNTNGSLDNSYNIQNQATGRFASGFAIFTNVFELALQPDGKVLVAGTLNSPSGNPSDNVGLARLNQDGSRDTSFTDWHPLGTSPTIIALALQADGRILIGNDFRITVPVVRNSIARLNSDGTLDMSFDTPGMTGDLYQVNGRNGNISAIAMQANGKSVLVGTFDHFESQPAEGILQLESDGSRDLLFDSNGAGRSAEVYALARQPDGKFLVGFLPVPLSRPSHLNSARRGGIGRLNGDGTTDSTFTSPFDYESNVFGVALQSDGKVLISGSVRLFGSQKTINFTRLNSDGTLDTSFVLPNIPLATIGGGLYIAIQPDGKIIINKVENSRGSLIRLNPNGSLDSSFSTDSLLGAYGALAIQPDGRIVVNYGLATSAPIVRLNVDGSNDPSFNSGTGPGSPVRSLILQPDGRILVGGAFSTFNGTARNRIARLNTNGSLDNSFVPNFDSRRTVGALALQPDGRILVGSQNSFSGVNEPSNRLFRLNSDGTLDTSFPFVDLGIEGDSKSVNAIVVQPDETIVIGGTFNVVNGVARLGLARLFGRIPEAPDPNPTPSPTPTPNPTPSPTPSTLQFSQSSYGVVEDCTFITVTVTRSGPISSAMTVDYETANGTASERSDYTVALGTIHFDAGEQSKTFNVLISEDRLVEGPEAFTVTLSNPTGGAALGSPSTATLEITDDASEPAGNAIDDASNFVCQNYHDFLNRQPDPAGLAFWTNEITSCQANPSCVERKRINVSAAFYLSIEFQETGYFVHRVYEAAYGNIAGSPVPIRLRDFLRDTQRIRRGVQVGIGNWQLQLEDNRNEFVTEFALRPEFLTVYPPGMSNTIFVETLNSNTMGSLSMTERTALLNELLGARNPSLTRAQVVKTVAADPDFRDREFNRAFVLMQYFGYLRRDPNVTPDNDFSGFDFWLTKLNQFNGDFVNSEMVKAFILSGEYRGRFGP